MSDSDYALSIPTPGGSIVPDWWAKAFGANVLYRTTLNTRDPEQRAILLRAINDDCDTVKSVLNLPIEVVGYTISPAAREVDGELHEWVRVVLHLADGRNVSAGSKGLLRSIMLTEQLDRPAPWNPPIGKVIKARDLVGGKQWYYMIDAGPMGSARDVPDKRNNRGVHEE